MTGALIEAIRYYPNLIRIAVNVYPFDDEFVKACHRFKEHRNLKRDDFTVRDFTSVAEQPPLTRLLFMMPEDEKEPFIQFLKQYCEDHSLRLNLDVD